MKRSTWLLLFCLAFTTSSVLEGRDNRSSSSPSRSSSPSSKPSFSSGSKPSAPASKPATAPSFSSKSKPATPQTSFAPSGPTFKSSNKALNPEAKQAPTWNEGVTKSGRDRDSRKAYERSQVKTLPPKPPVTAPVQPPVTTWSRPVRPIPGQHERAHRDHDHQHEHAHQAPSNPPAITRPRTVYIREIYTPQRYQTYDNRATTFYGGYQPQPFGDMFSPFLMGYLFSSAVSGPQRAEWLYHNREHVSQDRYDAMLAKDAELSARIKELEAKQVDPDPKYVLPGMTDNPDLAYSKETLTAAVDPTGPLRETLEPAVVVKPLADEPATPTPHTNWPVFVCLLLVIFILGIVAIGTIGRPVRR